MNEVGVGVDAACGVAFVVAGVAGADFLGEALQDRQALAVAAADGCADDGDAASVVERGIASVLIEKFIDEVGIGDEESADSAGDGAGDTHDQTAVGRVDRNRLTEDAAFGNFVALARVVAPVLDDVLNGAAAGVFDRDQLYVAEFDDKQVFVFAIGVGFLCANIVNSYEAVAADAGGGAFEDLQAAVAGIEAKAAVVLVEVTDFSDVTGLNAEDVCACLGANSGDGELSHGWQQAPPASRLACATCFAVGGVIDVTQMASAAVASTVGIAGEQGFVECAQTAAHTVVGQGCDCAAALYDVAARPVDVQANAVGTGRGVGVRVGAGRVAFAPVPGARTFVVGGVVGSVGGDDGEWYGSIILVNGALWVGW